jgi:hypothetical protein
MDESVLPYPLDLVPYVQFLPFQFHDFEIVTGGVNERVVDFLFERLVPFFEFRKMRFNRHVANLLA